MKSDKKIQSLPIEPLMLRAETAAALCGLSVSTWYQHMACGRIPSSIKIGKARLWRLDVLRIWCELNCPPIDKFTAMWQERQKKEVSK